MVKKVKRLIDIINERAGWSKKDWRKSRKSNNIRRNKWQKKMFRQYQSETGKSDLFKVIPDGLYCYTSTDEIIGEMKFEDCVIPRHKIIACPFWYSIDVSEDRLDHIGVVAMNQKHIGGCKLLKQTDDDMGGWGLLWDSCKECGLNYGRYE